MKDKKDVKRAFKTLSNLGQSTVISVASQYGTDYLKEGASSFAAELVIDSAASFFPGISGAVQAYKRKRFEENMSKAIEETISRIEEIERR